MKVSASYQFSIPGELKGKGRPRFGQGRTYTPGKTVSAEQWIRCHARFHAPKVPHDGAIALGLLIGVAIPKSYSNDKFDQCVQGFRVPMGTPDVDNCLKLVMDSFNKLFWNDDRQVFWLRELQRQYAEVPEVVVTMDAYERVD